MGGARRYRSAVPKSPHIVRCRRPARRRCDNAMNHVSSPAASVVSPARRTRQVGVSGRSISWRRGEQTYVHSREWSRPTVPARRPAVSGPTLSRRVRDSGRSQPHGRRPLRPRLRCVSSIRQRRRGAPNRLGLLARFFIGGCSQRKAFAAIQLHQQRKHSMRQVVRQLVMFPQLLPEDFWQIAGTCCASVRRIIGR